MIPGGNSPAIPPFIVEAIPYREGDGHKGFRHKCQPLFRRSPAFEDHHPFPVIVAGNHFQGLIAGADIFAAPPDVKGRFPFRQIHKPQIHGAFGIPEQEIGTFGPFGHFRRELNRHRVGELPGIRRCGIMFRVERGGFQIRGIVAGGVGGHVVPGEHDGNILLIIHRPHLDGIHSGIEIPPRLHHLPHHREQSRRGILKQRPPPGEFQRPFPGDRHRGNGIIRFIGGAQRIHIIHQRPLVLFRLNIIRRHG